MKKLFKRTLLTTVIIGICSPALAGNMSVVKQVHSAEGLTGVTASQTSNDIDYALGVEYNLGDMLFFHFSPGVVVNANQFANTLSSTNLTLAYKNVDLDPDSVNYNSVSYEVTAVNGNSTGDIVTLGKVTFKPSALVAESSLIVRSSSWSSLGERKDTSGTVTANIAQAKSQFGTLSIEESFDSVINNDDGYDLDGAIPESDKISWTLQYPSWQGWYNVATVRNTSVTLIGEAGKMTGIEGNDFTIDGTPITTWTTDSATLEYSLDGMGLDGAIELNTGSKSLSAQEFNLTVSYNYTSAAATAGSKVIGEPVGEWTLFHAPLEKPSGSSGGSMGLLSLLLLPLLFLRRKKH